MQNVLNNTTTYGHYRRISAAVSATRVLAGRRSSCYWLVVVGTDGGRSLRVKSHTVTTDAKKIISTKTTAAAAAPCV